jgi:hypothetical protein
VRKQILAEEDSGTFSAMEFLEGTTPRIASNPRLHIAGGRLAGE